MEGGAVSEPLKDMIKILSKLISDDNSDLIPGENQSIDTYVLLFQSSTETICLKSAA